MITTPEGWKRRVSLQGYQRGQAEAMLIATQTSTLSKIEDSIGPGAPDGIDVCASVAMERCDWRRKDGLKTEQILTNIRNGGRIFGPLRWTVEFDHVIVHHHHPRRRVSHSRLPTSDSRFIQHQSHYAK